MPIVPAGKARLMAAQTYADPMSANFNQQYDVNQPFAATKEDVPSFDLEKDIPEKDEEDDSAKGRADDKTLKGYVFNLLLDMGYAWRRVAEFKDKLAKKDIGADGTTRYTVEIPEETYPDPMTGKTTTLDNKDILKIVNDIKQKFGYDFNGATTQDGKITMNFISSPTATGEEDDEEQVVDNLDHVYGNPSKSGKKKAAATINEMIKEEKDDLVNKLKKIIGD